MSIRLYRFLQAFILLALVVFIGFKLISGTLSLYINMQYMPLTVFGIIMLAIMTFVDAFPTPAQNRTNTSITIQIISTIFLRAL